MSATHFSFGRVALILVRPGRAEVALQEVAGPLDRRLVGDRRWVLLAAAHALEAFLAHQPGNVVTADPDIATLEFLPGLARTVGAPVTDTRRLDLSDQPLVLERTPGRLPGPTRVVRAHRHAERSADRLDPKDIPPLFQIASLRCRVGSSS
jgi:hypothetical protein